MNLRDTFFHDDRPMCQICYSSIKANVNRSYGLDTKITKAYRFNVEIKSQCQIGITNVCDTSSDSDRRVWQIWQANVKPKTSFELNTKTCQNPNKFDHEVKGQRRIGIMNVRDTSSHDDTPMCQI